MKSSLIKVCILFIISSLCIGCATVRLPPTYEVSKDYASRNIKSIAVLPVELSLSTQALVNFKNIGAIPEDGDVCKLFHPIIVNAVKQKRYAILDSETMIELLEKNRLYNIQQIYALNKEELAKIFNKVDAVLYTFVIDASSVNNIKFFAYLMDTRDASLLWATSAKASEGGGMVGAVSGGVGGVIAAGASFLGPIAAAGGALVGDKISRFMYSKLVPLESKAKQTVVQNFKTLPKYLNHAH